MTQKDTDNHKDDSIVKIEIVEPNGDKNFMIAFEGKSEKVCQAYNSAIGDILREAGFNPYHQIGVRFNGDDQPGYHAWEVWKTTTKEELGQLVDQIKKQAEKML